MTEFHLDPLGGIAGDMFVAAMLDVRPDLERGLRETLSLCPLIESVSVTVAAHNDGVLAGHRFLVTRGDSERAAHHHEEGHGHRHAHSHRAWREIRSTLEGSRLDPAVIRHAIGIFTLLAEAEAKVHGTTPDNISFHEVGAWDSITDIISAAYLIASVDAARWTVGPIPLGSGRVPSAHGILPVPAPATAVLLEGFLTIDDGIGGERVTPTGAAILRYLCPTPALPSPRKLAASGHGFGTKRLAGISNCLRVLAFETIEHATKENDNVAVIEFEIDDQTGEDLAQAIDHLRMHPGVLDVTQAPVFGKKGRMMAHVRILAEPGALHSVATLVFEETSTIGVRHSLAHRIALPREAGEFLRQGRTLHVKTVARPGGTTTKMESDDLSGVAGKAARDTIRATVETPGKGKDK